MKHMPIPVTNTDPITMMSTLHVSPAQQRRHCHGHRYYRDHRNAENGRAKNREARTMAILIKVIMVVSAIAVVVGVSLKSSSSFIFVSSLSTINSAPKKLRILARSSLFHRTFRCYREKTATATKMMSTNPTSNVSTHGKKSSIGLNADEKIAAETKTALPSCLLLIIMFNLPPPLIFPVGTPSQTSTGAKTLFLSRPAYAVKERNEVLCGTGFFTNIAQYVCTEIGDISDERGPGRALNQQELESTDSLMDKLSLGSTSPTSSSTTSSSSFYGEEDDTTTSIPAKKE